MAIVLIANAAMRGHDLSWLPGVYMPRTNLDWLGIIGLWIGAIVLAFKSAGAPLMSGAPKWLAANWWNYVPLALVTFYLILAIYRQFHPPKSQFSPQIHAAAPVVQVQPVAPREAASVSAPAIEDRERKEHRERQRVIQSLNYAHQTAGMAMADVSSSGRERAAERQLPGMKAAMLSAHKVFGLPLPPESRTAVLDLELQRRMIETALPFLKEGHPDEARREAQAFLDRLLRTEGERT